MQNEIVIKLGDLSRNVLVPSSWNDLEATSALLIYKTIFDNPGDAFTAPVKTSVKLLSIVQYLLNIDNDFMAVWENARKKEGETAYLDEVRQVMHFALAGGKPVLAAGEKPVGLFEIEQEDGNYKYAPLLNLTKNPFKHINKPGRKKHQKVKVFYPPADGLENITIYEMGMTFYLFEAYIKTNDEAYAHRLLAILYRPSRPETKEERDSAWGGDRRQRLRGYEAKIDERIGVVMGWPLLMRQALLFWFAGCRQQIVDAYPKVFKKEGGGGRFGVDYGWSGVLLSVAEAGPMGALGEVSDQHYANVLTYMSMKYDEAREAEQKAAEAKRKKR